MENSLISYKIQVPLVSSGFVTRARLLDRLSNEQLCFFLLHATVGYGKTVLLTQYAKSCGERCAWYHLSEPDNDPVTFMQYLVKSMESALDAPLLDRSAAAPDDEVLLRLSYELAENIRSVLKSGGNRLNLILDDFQVITNEFVHHLLESLLAIGGSDLRIYIATKGAIPEFCSRYLLNGSVDLISQQELCCTEEETVEILLRETRDASVCERAARVCAAVEGWPAGVMFAALSIKQNGGMVLPAPQPVYERVVVNSYLMHEVFRKLPYEIQQFLAATSVLDYLNVGACNAVAKTEDSRSILEYLMMENLFLIKMSPDILTYRYHALFREFLQTQLKEGARREALQRAAYFYLQSQDKAQAVEYAMRGKDVDLVQYAIENTAPDLLEKGQLDTLRRWFTWLETQGVALSQRNTLIFGLYCYSKGDSGQAMESVDASIAMALAAGDELGYLWSVLEKVKIVRDFGSLKESDDVLSTLILHRNRHWGRLWYEIRLEQVINLLYQARYSEALEICEQMAMESVRDGEMPFSRLFDFYTVAIYFYMGDYRTASRRYEALQDYPQGSANMEARNSPISMFAAMMSLFRGELAGAKACIETTLAVCIKYNQRDCLWEAYIFQSYIAWATGDKKLCLYAIQQAEKACARWTPRHMFSKQVRAMASTFRLLGEEGGAPSEDVWDEVEQLHPFFGEAALWSKMLYSEILRQYFINHPQSIDKYTFLQNSAFTHWVKEKCSKMC